MTNTRSLFEQALDRDGYQMSDSTKKELDALCPLITADELAGTVTKEW